MKDKRTRGASCVPPPAPHFPVTPCTSQSAPRTPRSPPSHFPAGSLSPEAGAATAASKSSGRRSVLSWPSQPPLSRGAPSPPGPEVPDCQMSPHPSPHLHARSLASRRAPRDPPTQPQLPPEHTLFRPSHPSPSRLPYRSTPNTVHPGPGSGLGGNGGVQLQDRGCLFPGYLGQRLAGEGVVAAGARRPRSPSSRRTPAGRQPSTLHSAGHPRRPQSRDGARRGWTPGFPPRPLHSSHTGQRRACNTGHSVSEGPRRPQDLCRLHLVERQLKA